MKKCVLCDKEFVGYGNNAQPLAEGLCCDACYVDVINERRHEHIRNLETILIDGEIHPTIRRVSGRKNPKTT